MSRSKKKTPVCGNAMATTEKQDKRLANRALRRISRVKIQQGEEPPKLREVSNVWSMDKDGKSRFDPLRFPEYLRK